MDVRRDECAVYGVYGVSPVRAIAWSELMAGRIRNITSHVPGSVNECTAVPGSVLARDRKYEIPPLSPRSLCKSLSSGGPIPAKSVCVGEQDSTLMNKQEMN